MLRHFWWFRTIFIYIPMLLICILHSHTNQLQHPSSLSKLSVPGLKQNVKNSLRKSCTFTVYSEDREVSIRISLNFHPNFTHQRLMVQKIRRLFCLVHQPRIITTSWGCAVPSWGWALSSWDWTVQDSFKI